MLSVHQHRIDLGIVIRLISANRLILINQKEAPCKRLSGANIFDQADVIITHGLTLLIVLNRKFLPDQSHMLVRISLSGDGLELQLHRRDFEPACKRGQDIVLLL